MRKKEYVLRHSISANLVHSIRSKLGKKKIVKTTMLTLISSIKKKYYQRETV